MKDFEKQKIKAEINQEMMADAMDPLGEAETGEADDIYNQILGEIGMQMDDPNAIGRNQIASKVKVVP